MIAPYPAGGTSDTIARIVTRLNTELTRILKLPDVQKTFATLGVDAATSTPEELGTLVKTEVVKYAKLIQDIGIEKQ